MIFDTLTADWIDLAAAPSPWPALPGTLDDVLTAIHRAPDEALTVLLRALAGGDQLAGRTVVQTMLPKLRRFVAEGLDADALVAHLWLVAATYPLARRPGSIAANIALDARKHTIAEAGRDEPTSPDRLDRACHDAEVVRAGDILARASHLGLLSDETADVLWTVYVDGLPGRAAARRHGVTEATLRQRCSKGVRRLAEHRAALLAA